MGEQEKNRGALPVHVGIIMDGNGRWAKKRFLPRPAGHRAGAQNFRTITRYCSQIGIKYLTVYAFSTENWTRPKDEVGALLRLFRDYLEEALRDFMDENIRVRFIGDVSAFPPQLQELIHEVEEASAQKTGMVLNLAMNYGGRAEIVRAARRLAEDAAAGRRNPEDVTEEVFSQYLYTGGQPDPDLHPAQRGGAAFQLPAVAERLRGIRLLRHFVAGLYHKGSGPRSGDLRLPAAALWGRVIPQCASYSPNVKGP